MSSNTCPGQYTGPFHGRIIGKSVWSFSTPNPDVDKQAAFACCAPYAPLPQSCFFWCEIGAPKVNRSVIESFSNCLTNHGLQDSNISFFLDGVTQNSGAPRTTRGGASTLCDISGADSVDSDHVNE